MSGIPALNKDNYGKFKLVKTSLVGDDISIYCENHRAYIKITFIIMDRLRLLPINYDIYIEMNTDYKENLILKSLGFKSSTDFKNVDEEGFDIDECCEVLEFFNSIENKVFLAKINILDEDFKVDKETFIPFVPTQPT